MRDMTKAHQKKSKKVSKSHCTNEGVLTSPAGMGGLDSGGGHDFQSRYIVCHAPEWLTEPGFTQWLHEGTGDVDIRFGNLQPECRYHIQIKDFDVGLADLKKILAHFMVIDQKMPNVYQKFTIASPSVKPQLNPLKRALDRIRSAELFYDSQPQALNDDRAKLNERINALKLEPFESVLQKVSFHVGLHNFGSDESCRNLFSGSLLRHASYRDRLAAGAADSAYEALFTEVRGCIGIPMDRAAIEAIIDSAARGENPIGEPAIHVVVHNWAREKYDLIPDHILDWTKYFDHDSKQRRVPTLETWRDGLLPELLALREKLRINSIRLIKLRGKCCLSTGIALGQKFSQSAGWQFEIPQPPQTEPWRSDAIARRDYPLRAHHTETNTEFQTDSTSNAIAIVVSVRRDSILNASKYLANHSIGVQALYDLRPATGTGELSVADAEEAQSIALAVRRELDQAQDKYDAEMTHLFFNGPFALAVFIGQQLNTVGSVQLYEFLGHNIGYTPSCLLEA